MNFKTHFLSLFQENVSLISEINELRHELKDARTHIADLDAALGLNRKNNEHTQQLVQLITMTKANPMLEMDYREAKRVIEVQRAEIHSLRMRIDNDTITEEGAVSSVDKLPPIKGTS